MGTTAPQLRDKNSSIYFGVPQTLGKKQTKTIKHGRCQLNKMPSDPERSLPSRGRPRQQISPIVTAAPPMRSKTSPSLTSYPGQLPTNSTSNYVPTVDVTTTPEFHRFVTGQQPPTPYAEGLDLMAAARSDKHGREHGSDARRPHTTTSTPSTIATLSRSRSTLSATNTSYRPQQSSFLVPLSSRTSTRDGHRSSQSGGSGAASRLVAPSLAPETSLNPQRTHTPPTNWGFAQGSSAAIEKETETEKERERRFIVGGGSSGGGGRPPRSSPLASLSLPSSDHLPRNIVQAPRATSAGGVVITARLQLALLRANERPTSCPGDPEGRLTSEYFRPSTGDASLGSSHSRHSLQDLLRPSSRSTSTSRPNTGSSIGSVEERFASTKIQSIARMRMANVYCWDPVGGLAAEKGATQIQRVFRGFIVRFQSVLEAREQAKAAAILIQKNYRGQLGRFVAMDKRVERKASALIKLQCAWRYSIAMRRVHELRLHRETTHSTKIQAWWQGARVREVVDPHPMHLRRKRRVQQRTMMKKHASTILTIRGNVAKQKLIQKRLKEAAKNGLIVSSRRSRSRGGGRRGRGRSKSPSKRSAVVAVVSQPLDPVALLQEVLLYHAVEGFRDPKKVAKTLAPSIIFVHRMHQGGDGSLPLDPEVASFVRVSIVHALSSEGTVDVFGGALAMLQDISSSRRSVEKPVEEKHKRGTSISPSRRKKRMMRKKRSPVRKPSLPKLAYTNVVKDFYHANVMQHPEDLEGLRHLLAVLMVGIETHWRDEFECGETMDVFYARLRRMSQRLMQRAREAVAFRREASINARKAAEEEDGGKGEKGAKGASKVTAATPRGTGENREERMLRQSEQIVNLLDGWFFAPLLKLLETRIDIDGVGVDVSVCLRGKWIVVRGFLSKSKEETTAEVMTAAEKATTTTKTTIMIKSYVLSREEASAVLGADASNDDSVARCVLRRVKVLRGEGQRSSLVVGGNLPVTP